MIQITRSFWRSSWLTILWETLLRPLLQLRTQLSLLPRLIACLLLLRRLLWFPLILLQLQLDFRYVASFVVDASKPYRAILYFWLDFLIT
nr:hypothetical protein Iba_chr03eCG8070 [Ipomoea batatas]GMC92015.1 hypothetical protein Iba_scaffold64838CG0010 [Ipomoea batatas]GMD42568.1 hypothetical protein Iba_scaffold45577CG0010 [Ipomoea batatas]